MRERIEAIESEYRRYKLLAEGALQQLDDAQLGQALGPEGNSVATIVWHVSGNFCSRFTDFLTTDGEKPWRNRDAEFEARQPSRAELLATWEQGWTVLFEALRGVSDDDLTRTITIRGQAHTVHEALLRSLAHASYHIGQIVFLAHLLRGPEWQYLTIPPGQSSTYNERPTLEKAPRAIPPRR